MRVPGWMFIVGVLTLIAGTALCSIATFGMTRQMALDLAEQGVEPSSPGELWNVLLGGGAENVTQAPDFDEAQLALTSTAQAVAVAPVVVVPTVTPAVGVAATYNPPTPGIADTQPTLVPTEAVSSTDAMAYPTVDPRRKTILLLGIDQRSAVEERGPFRTDTMILISVDPVRKTAGMLSIPRDLWVSIPGSGVDRINNANAIGDTNAYPGGGPALAVETIRMNLGVPVDKYVLVNFDVFLTLTDLLAPDGIEICINEVIDDPDYPDAGYGYIHVHFDPGCQKLNAEELLQYARTRATYGGDFDRARRQQQVIDTMRSHLLSVGGVTNFITQAPAIWNELTGSFKTNLSMEEIISLGLLVSEIPDDNIAFGVIDNRYVELGTSTTGDQVLIPQQGAIRDLIQQVFNPEPDLTLADLRTRAEGENASIVVYNNTDIAGLAGQTRELLESFGVTIKTVGNTPIPNNANTVIRDYTGNPWTARYLATLLDLPQDRVQPGGDGLTSDDVMIVVGPDIQPLLTGE
jgi:polyisoprenyl-teichoic acid--peptidoglycan teichoic acid transferase